MEVGQRVDDREPDPSAGVGMMAHRRRNVIPDHDAAAVLDDEEVGPDDTVVVAEQVAARRVVVVLRQRVDGTELAAHVVGTGAIWPNGGRRTTSFRSPKLTRYVRFAEPFGNWSTSNGPSTSGS